jgi:hypothetical protein
MNYVDELERLERLRSSGGLSQAEFEIAKSKLLGGAGSSSANAKQLARLEKEVELSRLDRAWEYEKESFMVQGRRGRYIPSTDEALWTAVIGFCGVGGLTWFWLSFSTDQFGSRSPIAWITLLSGIVCIGRLFWAALIMHNSATHYEIRKRVYFEQREEILQRR